MCDEIRFFPQERKLCFFLNSIRFENDKIGKETSACEVTSLKLANTDGILGKITAGEDSYILHIQESCLALDINDLKMYRSKNIESINISNLCRKMQKKLTREKIRDLASYKDKDMENFLKFLNESPLYFTHRKAEDDKFLWNKFLRKNLGYTQNQAGIVFLYNGYFNVKACLNFQYVLLSFLSSNRVGPRYFSRGVDSEGNVSNFVKTKYLVYSNDNLVFDIIIYRGSVPVYWEQKGSLRELQCIEKDSFRACFRHFYHNFRENESCVDGSLSEEVKKNNQTELHEDGCYITTETRKANVLDEHTFTKPICHFNNILVINLLSTKKSEEKLSLIYKELLKNLQIEYFDFNLNKYHLNYKKLKHLFIAELRRKLLNIHTMGHESNKKVIFRLNCLDCLDRTNLASYLICDYYHTQMEIPKDHLKTLFLQNGNAISLFNAGSNALKNELAVKEKRSIKGLFDDFYIFTKRVICDKFNDKQKMEMIDMLLGRDRASEEEKVEIDEYVEKGMKLEAEKFPKGADPVNGENMKQSEKQGHKEDLTRDLSKQNDNIKQTLNETEIILETSVDELQKSGETILLVSMQITSKSDLLGLNFVPNEPVKLVILCVNKIVSSLKSVFSEEHINYKIQNFVLVSKKSYFNNHILIFCRMNCIKKIQNIKYQEKKRNLQFTKKNCLLALQFMYENKSVILFDVIMDKLYNTDFFQHEELVDVYIITGVFLRDKFIELFNILNLNYIETNGLVKLGFKENVNVKEFKEQENVVFLEFAL